MKTFQAHSPNIYLIRYQYIYVDQVHLCMRAQYSASACDGSYKSQELHQKTAVEIIIVFQHQPTLYMLHSTSTQRNYTTYVLSSCLGGAKVKGMG